MTEVSYPFGEDPQPEIPIEVADDVAEIIFGFTVAGYIVSDVDAYQAYLEYCEDLYGNWRKPNPHIDRLGQLARDLVNNHYIMTT